MSNCLTDEPLVSIVVPVFNGEQFLRESLDSMIAQTYQRIEILVMDDASTDNTPEIVLSYGEKVHSHRQKQNRGIYENANDGIAMAQGKYIAIYHADDIYHPNMVEHEVEFLQRHASAGAVFTQVDFIDSAGREFGEFRVQPELQGGHPFDYCKILNALLNHKNRFLICPTAMVPASVYRDVGGYRQDKFLNSSDLDMWLRISRKYSIGILEKNLLKYRLSQTQSSRRYHHLRTGEERYFLIMDEHLEEYGQEIAEKDSLEAYDANRSEDQLMRAVNHYILDQTKEAQKILAQVELGKILKSTRVHRGRLFLLFLLLQCLVRVFRIPSIASLFYRRWHTSKSKIERIARL